MSFVVEAVEKVPKQILGRDAEKSDLIEYATINDLMLGKGQVTPENVALTRQKGFSYRLVRAHRALIKPLAAEALPFQHWYPDLKDTSITAFLGAAP